MRSPPESVPERGEYRVVFSPSVAVRDAPWGRKVGTKAQGDVVRTDMRSVGNDRKGGGWVRLEGGYEGGEGWMLLHGAALGLGTLLEARRPYCPTYLLHISLTSPPHLPHISPHLPASPQVPATFQMIFLTGWAPHESMQKPLSPGSATVSLKDLSLPGVPGELLPGEPPDEPQLEPQPGAGEPKPFLTPSRRPGGPRED